jgi:thioester reductase-like protein
VSADQERLLRLLKEARERLEQERKRRTEPIAIVGVGCRFPGGASSPAAFWDLLVRGVDAVGEVPPDPTAPGKCYSKHGAFLEQIDGFEPEAFGIAPREAVGMDPQQRLLLEVAWEALEQAGIAPDSLRGSNTGVWVGLSLDDYARRSVPTGELERIDAHTALGNARSVAAGRIAYLLGVHGPALQLDTACSSSLVAVHLACQSLRAGECELALTGGVNLLASPEASVALCKLQALSHAGRCKSFDAAADGYVRGEGCGVLVLKRLSAAEAAGDRIYAVIRGSAVNHNGASNGLPAPNGLAQEAVIRAALGNAGLEPNDVDFVEAQGTGTPLGDPIEVLALSRAYCATRPREAPLYLGCVKTNLGHLEAASGMAGLIKTVLCLAHDKLVPHLHFEHPNPQIPWQSLALRVTQQLSDWPRRGRARAVAGLSAFGISGTNAHLIVEAAPSPEPSAVAAPRSAELFVLSARTDHGLRARAEHLARLLRESPEPSLTDVAFSLATTRSLLEKRAVFVAEAGQPVTDTLEAFARGEQPSRLASGRRGELNGKLAWLFGGSNVLRPGAGLALANEWPVFGEAFEAACTELEPYLKARLRDVLGSSGGSAESSLLAQPGYAAAASFALEWAHAALWRSWGVEPDFVAGDGVGEITAACVASVLSLCDGARLVGARHAERPEQLEASTKRLAYSAPSVGFIAGATGELAGVEVTTPDYWARQAQQQPRFAAGIAALAAAGAGTFLELGVGSGLLELVAASLPDQAPLLLALPSQHASETAIVLERLACWLAHGGAPTFQAIFPQGARRVELPTSPWQRSRYWAPPPLTLRSARSAPAAAPASPPPLVLAQLSASERIERVTELVRTEVARVLGMAHAELRVDELLQHLGLDSMLAVELRAALERRFDVQELVAFDPALSTTSSIASRLLALLAQKGEQAPAIDREPDARLPVDIRPASSTLPADEPSHALLTGATGFLGAHLLHELLTQTNAHVTCLVRGHDEAHATQRLQKSLQHYGLWREGSWPRVSVVVGELSEPRLGLSGSAFSRLAESVDAIYNNAAHLSFVASYEEMKPSHVGATLEILRLAATGRSKAVHHVSSLSVHQTAAYGEQRVTELTPLAPSKGLHLPYYQCKWVSEALVWAAARNGMQVTVHRPSFIGGSSNSGLWNPADLVCRMLVAILEMRAVPADLELLLDFSAVDYVARSIVHLSGQAASRGQAFHLQQPNCITLAALAEILGSLGHELRKLPYAEWLASVEVRAEGSLYPLLPLLKQRFPPEGLTFLELAQARHRPHFSCERTLQSLTGSGIECPQLDRKLIGLYLTRLVESGELRL